MTSENTSDNLNLGRGWLNRAAEMLDSCEDHRSDAEFAHAAAIIGNGFIALAHAERAAASMAEVSQVRQAILTMSDEPEMTLVEAVEREKRAEAEARPHDDEPKPPPCTGCFGPFSDGTHGPGCTQRCQDCQGAPDGPQRCRCRDGCTCEHPPSIGQLHRPNCPAYSPVAAYALREATDRG